TQRLRLYLRRFGDLGMPAYFCFVQVHPGGVPELRMLDCEDDDGVPGRLAVALIEWPRAHRVEVTNGDRVVLIATGVEIDGLRAP
ncbi:MAG: hypothetical protein ABW169_12305, partial [Sphingobium sp.]